MIPGIGLFDVCLGFLYLAIIYFGAILYKNEKINHNPEYKYFILSLSAKLIGAIGFVLYSTYYMPGDTFFFFRAGTELNTFFSTDFTKAIEVFFSFGSDFDPNQYAFSAKYGYKLKSQDVFSIIKITSVFTFFGFKSYLASSILFSLFSFLGLWFGYSNICKLYQKHSKYILIAFFFVPTALLWSSGILKDTVTQGCIGWLLYAFSNLFIFKRKALLSFIFVVLSSFVLFLLKPYILYLLIPCLFIWTQSNLKNLIPSSFIRFLIKPILIAFLSVGGYFLVQNVSGAAGKYGVDNLESTLKGFQSWHGYLADNKNQSGYTLGEMEFTPLGVLKKAPAALNVTFFRPYFWEARNISTLLGAVEGAVLFFYVMFLLIKIRGRFFRIMFRNKEVFFMMLFAITFGITVGVSSYNFGALSRYKIPATMFFILSLLLIQSVAKEEKR